MIKTQLIEFFNFIRFFGLNLAHYEVNNNRINVYHLSIIITLNICSLYNFFFNFHEKNKYVFFMANSLN